MFDLSFHALEYAAYHPYMFNDRPDAFAERPQSEAKPGRYQSLPPASPRVTPIQSFASSVARLVNRILTAIQRVGADIFPRARSADSLARQSNETCGPTRLDNFEKSALNKIYTQAREGSLRALESVFSSKETTVIFERLAHFCECRRRMANLNPAVQSQSDSSTENYFANLKRLIGESELKKLKACKKSLERGFGNRNLSNEQELKLHFMWMVVGNLIEFGESESATLISVKSGTPIT